MAENASMWNTCPKCGNDEPIYGHLDMDGDTVWQDVTCIGCGFKWQEVYEFTHNENRDGEKLDWKGDVIKDEIITLTPASTSGSPIDLEEVHICPKCDANDWYVDGSDENYLICNACNTGYPRA
jgi:predicted nucleic-acid-binding Zn-ribbon protein